MGVSGGRGSVGGMHGMCVSDVQLGLLVEMSGTMLASRSTTRVAWVEAAAGVVAVVVVVDRHSESEP